MNGQAQFSRRESKNVSHLYFLRAPLFLLQGITRVLATILGATQIRQIRQSGHKALVCGRDSILVDMTFTLRTSNEEFE